MRETVLPTAAWNPEWDQCLLEASLESHHTHFDPAAAMLVRRIGDDFNYHSGLRNTTAHPTRDSLGYALLLLEGGGYARLDRASAILDRVLALQETDPQSKFYGLWGYYLEEPAPRMFRADWNWADFNGATLALVLARHAHRLPPALLLRLRDALRHACASILRRNVTMDYTNIAVQGTFVLLAAADLLADSDLRAHAADRLHRLAAAIDLSGSFAEYNSPNYANVTLVNLTRMRMLLADPAHLALVHRIHERLWLHLGRHWHPPTAQLAGPMSRCYSTDIGHPLWLQKSLGGRLVFASLDDIRLRRVPASGEVAVLAYHCPDSVADLFLRASDPHEHREIFLPGRPPDPPVQGTTWLDRAFSLGSVNRTDFWIQRRPLLAYWGGPARPARYLAARFFKDDYDFVSALSYNVQSRGSLIGLVNFRSPGGDRHAPIGPLPNAEFTASRLRLRFDLAGVPGDAALLVDGSPAGPLPLDCAVTSSIALDLGDTRLWLRVREAVFAARIPRLSICREQGLLTISIDLLRSPSPLLVRWREVPAAYIAFTLSMDSTPSPLPPLEPPPRHLGV